MPIFRQEATKNRKAVVAWSIIIRWVMYLPVMCAQVTEPLNIHMMIIAWLLLQKDLAAMVNTGVFISNPITGKTFGEILVTTVQRDSSCQKMRMENGWIVS